ncbi:MAG TPA: urocanate hydratase, partial [candidate division Zixibacteria bacterium]|nr:urocanate hydratase [candidate division Zixibacteria bacterium]
VGVGLAIHAGQVIVADGTKDMDLRLNRVLTNDPLTGVFRHADAGYPEAWQTAQKQKVKIPLALKK